MAIRIRSRARTWIGYNTESTGFSSEWLEIFSMAIDIYDSEAIASTLRKSMSATFSEYQKRSNFYYDVLPIPEYLLTVRMYDKLWNIIKPSSKIPQNNSELTMSLEPPIKGVKYWSGQRGRTARVIAGNKRHDICIWSNDNPISVIEVKRFTNRYGPLYEDVERIEASVKGKNSIQFGILAFLGYWSREEEQIAKYRKHLSERYSDPRYTVYLQEIQRTETPPGCDRPETLRFPVGTIVFK